MEQWRKDFAHFINQKKFVVMLVLTGVCGYGFLCTHQTVGIDDTPFLYYFEEGLNAIVGRWVLYLLNKVLHFAQFGPFMMDLVGVMLLMCAALVWTVLFFSVFGRKIPDWGYLFFACFFVANPLHAEVFTYYLHNGAGLGFLCCGISLCLFREGLKSAESMNSGESLFPVARPFLFFVASPLLLFVAIGCYESFMVVWIVGFLLLVLSLRYSGEKINVLLTSVKGVFAVVVAFLLRTVMIPGVIWLFGLQDMRDEAVRRSMGEMVSWAFDAAKRQEFIMAIKRTYVMYGAFGYAYLPIAVFVLAIAVMLVTCVVFFFRKKDVFCPFLTGAALFCCFLLVFIEGKVTLYRAAQFLPIVCAYGVLLVGFWFENHRSSFKKLSGITGGAAIIVLSVLLFRQCLDLNQWFYIDDLKYQDAKRTMNEIGYELQKDFDTTKPVIFTGTYKIPKSLIENAYVPYGSETFYKIKRLTDPVDAHLLEKFYRQEYGVWVAQTPSLSVLDWARYAFDTDEELVRFFAMHGISIQPLLDTKEYEKAEIYSLDLPSFPERGSIVDRGDYIIVHF